MRNNGANGSTPLDFNNKYKLDRLAHGSNVNPNIMCRHIGTFGSFWLVVRIHYVDNTSLKGKINEQFY